MRKNYFRLLLITLLFVSCGQVENKENDIEAIKKALQKTYKVCPKGINLTEKSLDIAIKELQNRK